MRIFIHNFTKAIQKLILLLCACLSAGMSLAQQGQEKERTDTKFPSYIKRMNYFGERPDWSHDGKKILFVGRSFGDVYERCCNRKDPGYNSSLLSCRLFKSVIFK